MERIIITVGTPPKTIILQGIRVAIVDFPPTNVAGADLPADDPLAGCGTTIVPARMVCTHHATYRAARVHATTVALEHLGWSVAVEECNFRLPLDTEPGPQLRARMLGAAGAGFLARKDGGSERRLGLRDQIFLDVSGVLDPELTLMGPGALAAWQTVSPLWATDYLDLPIPEQLYGAPHDPPITGTVEGYGMQPPSTESDPLPPNFPIEAMPGYEAG